jgi:lipopolysaccharide transport system ATP-binding protein
MEPSIQVSNITKRYRIGQAPLSVKSLFSRRNDEQGERYHWAVDDVSFALRPGESLGIIGPNGAGKTTILKLLSKVTRPTSGEIRMNGRFSALIELGAGFHPELTGRENVYLNGTILGMRRAEISARFDEIVEFAGIGKYLDTPVKRYSSGMYARLGFAVAAHVDPDILLVDEVLAVGDMAFQVKCYDRMVKMLENGTALVFVSHNMRAVQRVCQRCIVMYRGRPAFFGPTAEATAEYSNIVRQAAVEFSAATIEGLEEGISQRIMTHDAVIEKVELLRANGEPTFALNAGEPAVVRLHLKAHKPVLAPVFACRITTPEAQVVYDFTTNWAELVTPDFAAGTTAVVEFHINTNLVGGTYYLGVNVAYEDLTRYYDRIDRALDFVVSGGQGARGIANLDAQFRVCEVYPVNIN